MSIRHIIMISFFLALAVGLVASASSSDSASYYDEYKHMFGQGVEIKTFPNGIVLVSIKPGWSITGGPSSMTALLESRSSEPKSTAWTNSSTIVLVWTDGHTYLKGANITVNVLALGPNGPVEGKNVNITLDCGGNTITYTVTTGPYGLAKAIFAQPSDFEGTCWLDVHAADADVHVMDWELRIAPIYVYVLRNYVKPYDENYSYSIPLFAFQADGTPFNGTVNITIYLRYWLIFSNGSYVEDSVFIKQAVNFVNGFGNLAFNLRDYVNLPNNASFVFQGDMSIDRFDYIRLQGYTELLAADVLVDCCSSYNPEKGLLYIPIAVSYPGGKVFQGQLYIGVWKYMSDGDWRYEATWVNVSNGIGVLAINASGIRAISIKGGIDWDIAIAKDLDGRVYPVHFSGTWLTMYMKPQQSAPTPPTTLELTLYRTWRHGFSAHVEYGGVPLANVTVCLYLPWSFATEPICNVTDSSGTTFFSSGAILSLFPDNNTLKEEMIKLITCCSSSVVAYVTYMNQTAVDDTAISFNDIIGWPEFDIGNVTNESFEICVDKSYIDISPPLRAAALIKQYPFIWFGQEIYDVLYTGKACTRISINNTDIPEYHGLIYGGIVVPMSFCICTIVYDANWPYLINLERVGRVHAYGCHVYGDPLAYTNESIIVEGMVYNRSNGKGLENASVIAVLAYEYVDGTALAETTSNSSGLYHIEFPPADGETEVSGNLIAVYNGYFVPCSWGEAVDFDGWVRSSEETPIETPGPTGTVTGTPTTPGTSVAPPVGGTIVMPGLENSSNYWYTAIIIASIAVTALLFARRRG